MNRLASVLHPSAARAVPRRLLRGPASLSAGAALAHWIRHLRADDHETTDADGADARPGWLRETGACLVLNPMSGGSRQEAQAPQVARRDAAADLTSGQARAPPTGLAARRTGSVPPGAPPLRSRAADPLSRSRAGGRPRSTAARR